MLREHVPAVVVGDLNLLRCLTACDVPSSVVAYDTREPTLRSRHARRVFTMASPSEPERAVEDLVSIAGGFAEPPVLYYGTDAMLLLLSRARQRLGELYRFCIPPADLIEQLVDKARFAALAERTGIRVPESVCSEELTSARDLLARLPLPFAFKPCVHIGWLARRAATDRMPKKALRANTRAEALSLYDQLSRLGPFVVQRWIQGDERAVHSFHSYADERARVLGWFAGRKIRTYPREAGVSTYLELVSDDEVAMFGLSIVDKLGVRGPLKIDFKRDEETGKLYVLELNPRFTLWCRLGAAAGVNLPAIAHSHLTGGTVPEQTRYRTDVRWLSFPNDLRSFIRSYWPSGELGVFDWLSSYRGKKVYDVFAWNDPAPTAASMLDYARRAMQRLARAAATP